MPRAFKGNIDQIADDLKKSGVVYGLSMGRRAPMHCMHVDCILEIARSGLQPIIVIGSTNGPESPLYDPVRNPLTVDQQKEQFRQAMSDIDYNEPLIITVDDNPDDNQWMQSLVKKVKGLGLYGKSLVHMRSKSADAEKAADPIKPLSLYTQAFINSGLSVWHSFNSNPLDDDINASDIRKYDLENLTVAQRRIIATPGYLISIAREARKNNPDRALLEKYDIPLTVLDLSFDRLYQEAGIRTVDIVKDVESNGVPVTLEALITSANSLVQQTREERAIKAAQEGGPKKPVLLIGPGASPETAAILKKDAFFDVVSSSIGKFQSGEHFCEIGYGEKAPAATKKKLKDATVVIVQSTGEPVGDNVMHLLEMVHTARLHGAKEINVVIPFMAYGRQDRSFDGRCTSQAIEMFAGLLKSVGVDKVLTFTMHSQAGIKQCQNILGDHFVSVSLEKLFAQYLREKFPFTSEHLAIGAPDGGEKRMDEGQTRAETLAEAFNSRAMFRIRKTHVAVSQSEVLSFDGDVKGKDCVLIDDMVDGGSTIVNAAKALKAQGAKSVTCCFTHGLLTKGRTSALEKLMLEKEDGAYVIDRLVMTDSVPDCLSKVTDFAKQYPDRAENIDVISLGPAILAEIKRQLHTSPAAAPQVEKGLQR